jgi:hypothetical protein
MNLNSFDKAIRDRGQLYKFTAPSSKDIAKYLFDLTGKLKIDAPDSFFTEGLFTIAENCEGSLRAAVSALERCIMGEFYTDAEIQNELGFMSNENMMKILYGLLAKDKTMIKPIIDFGAEEFFHRAKKTLLDAEICINTGYSSSDWKEKFAEKVKSSQGHTQLMEVFLTAWEGTYFKPDLFLYRLSEFLSIPKTRERIKG